MNKTSLEAKSGMTYSDPLEVNLVMTYFELILLIIIEQN